MHEYKIFLKELAEPVTVAAEDVNMISADGPSVGVYLNFWQRTDDGSDFTVAAVPLAEVRYVLSAG